MILSSLIVLANLFLLTRGSLKSGIKSPVYSISACPESPIQTPQEEDSEPKINRVSQQYTSQINHIGFTSTRLLFILSDFFKPEAIQIIPKFLLEHPRLFFSVRVSRIILAPNAP